MGLKRWETKTKCSDWPVATAARQRGMVCWRLQTRPPLLSPGPSLTTASTASLPHATQRHGAAVEGGGRYTRQLRIYNTFQHMAVTLSSIINSDIVQTLTRGFELIKAAAAPCSDNTPH